MAAEFHYAPRILNMTKTIAELSFEGKPGFPLTKNEFGFYPPHQTGHGPDLRCPNCGDRNWVVKSYQHIECTTCTKAYSNLGIYGLQEL